MANLVPLILIGLLALATLPFWPWSRGWGWAPFAILVIGLGTLLLFRWTVIPEA